jgi:hypothetical protein
LQDSQDHGPVSVPCFKVVDFSSDGPLQATNVILVSRAGLMNRACSRSAKPVFQLKAHRTTKPVLERWHQRHVQAPVPAFNRGGRDDGWEPTTVEGLEVNE